MHDHSFTASYDVNSFLVNPARRLGLVSLLNILQDVAWRHGDHQGHGWEAEVARGAFWVMTRQIVVIEAAAHLGARVDVQTWLRPPAGPFVIRDFVVGVEGRRLARGAVSFMLIDTATRRPRRDVIAGDEVVYRVQGHLDLEPRKIAPLTDARVLETFRVRNSDLDVNYHVNNTRYAQWILDAVPLAWHSRYDLRQYEICFLAEAKSGDEVRIEMREVDGGALVQGVRVADGRPIFAAQVGVA